jgi:hypothetical protein
MSSKLHQQLAGPLPVSQIYAALSLIHPYGAPETLPLQQQVECRVDVLEGNLVSYELVQLQLLCYTRQTK